MKITKWTDAYTSNTQQLPQSTEGVKSHIWCHNSFWFHTTLLLPLHNNSQASVLLLLTSTSKFQVFFKMKYHIYCSICISLTHSRCIKLFFLGFYLNFTRVTNKVFESCAPNPILVEMKGWSYCALLLSILISGTYMSWNSRTDYRSYWMKREEVLGKRMHAAMEKKIYMGGTLYLILCCWSIKGDGELRPEE